MSGRITLTPEIAYRTICPSTAFWDHRKYVPSESVDDQLSWGDSPLNPKNRINSLTPVQKPTWRIDGCTSLGTQFFTVPTSMYPLPPLRVNTFLPDPNHWPARLRLDLNLDKSFLFRDSRIRRFEISQHILRALEHWSASVVAFDTIFRDLPFGSRIMFENMSEDIQNIRIRLIRTHDLERQLQPLASLKLNQSILLPPALDILQLTLLRQLQDSAALVQIVGRAEDDVVVFKTLSDTPKYLYYELANLHVVTKRCIFGGKVAVVGFTIQYHQQGSLRDILPVRRLHGTLAENDQVKWASQVVKALQHIKSKGSGWYCDLRLDNILLSDEDNIVLIDFEQRGVLPAFASLLDNYLQYVNALVHESLLTPAERKECADLYDIHIRPFIPKRKDHHQGCVTWLCMNKSEREASELYMLGRLLWCIFEGVSAPQKELWMEYPHEPDIEFPQFRHTPKEMRQFILSCTPGWDMVERKLQREAFNLSLRGSSDAGRMGETDFLSEMVEMWHSELDRAKDFLSNRGTRCEISDDCSRRSSMLDDILQKI